MMMNKTKSPSSTVVKYFLIVPLFFLLVAANSVYAAQNEDNTATGQPADDHLQAVPRSTIEPGDLPVALPATLPEMAGNDTPAVKDDQPQYPGGENAMMKFLADNFRYPVIAQENGIQGRVVCNFVITKDGSIDNVSVFRGVDPSLDAEAMRIIKKMPKWEPAMKQGKAVDVQAMLPVVFRLQGDNPQDDLLTKEDREALFEKNKPTKADIKEGTLIIDEVVVVGYGGAGKNAGSQQPAGQDKYSEAERSYLKYISDNVRYPVIAQENGITGMVKAVYSVNEKGEVSNIRIAKDANPSLGAEVNRVIQSLPSDIVLNKVGGKANPDVDVSVNFRLQGEGSSSGASVDCDIVVVGYGSKKNS